MPGKPISRPTVQKLWLFMTLLLAVPLWGSRADATSQSPAGICARAHAVPDAPSIAFRTCGKGAAVLLVPGGPGLDADYMQSLAEDIARMGYRAILIEPRGTGASAGAPDEAGQLTMDGSIADLEAVRRAIGADRLTIVGHSFGGAVAQAYAAAHQEQVSKLILLDSVGLSFARPSEPLDGWRRHLTADDLARYDALRAEGDRIGAMKIKFRGSFYDRRKAEVFIAWLSDATITLSLGPLSADYERRYDIFTAARIAPYEVVLIAGDMDWIRGYERQMVEAYPKLRRYIIPRAGHFPWLDAPGPTRRALQKALRQGAGSPPRR